MHFFLKGGVLSQVRMRKQNSSRPQMYSFSVVGWKVKFRAATTKGGSLIEIFSYCSKRSLRKDPGMI